MEQLSTLPRGDRYMPEEELRAAVTVMYPAVLIPHLAWMCEDIPNRLDANSLAPFRKGLNVQEDFSRSCDRQVREVENDPSFLKAVLARIEGQ